MEKKTPRRNYQLNFGGKTHKGIMVIYSALYSATVPTPAPYKTNVTRCKLYVYDFAASALFALYKCDALQVYYFVASFSGKQ